MNMSVDNKKNQKSFRHWCNEMWYQHREELLSIGERNIDYDMQYYFNKYKWWLRDQYKNNNS